MERLDLYLGDTWFVSRLEYLMSLISLGFSRLIQANFYTMPRIGWARGGAVVEALCCKPENRGFPVASGIFHWNNHSGRPMTLGSSDLQQKWVPGIFLIVKIADNLTTFMYRLSLNVGASGTYRSCQGLYRGCFTCTANRPHVALFQIIFNS
jgi:hypothetical protein